MPRLPQEIWVRRIESEYAELRAKGCDFSCSADKTEYVFVLDARGLAKSGASIVPVSKHEVSVKLTRDYTYAGGFELAWLSPIFHPNIDERGKVCIQLVNKWAAGQTLCSIVDALVQLLQNPNPDSPLNYEAAQYFIENHSGSPPEGYRLSRPRVIG